MKPQSSAPSMLEKKIRSYLEALSPSARDMLIRGIENAKTRGDADDHMNLILSVARAAGAKNRKPDEVEPVLQQAFFRPLAPFIVAQSLPIRQAGRVAPMSVDRVWTWFRRDVSRNAIRKLVGDLLNVPDPLAAHAARKARESRTGLLNAARAYIENLSTSEDDIQRLAGQLGDRHTLDDARDILDILELCDVLDATVKPLPPQMADHDETALHNGVRAVTSFIDSHPRSLHLLAIRLLEHSENPAVLVRIARKLAKSDNAASIEKSLFRPLVDVAWSEIERRVEIVRERRSGSDPHGTLEEALLDLHRVVRRVQIAIDVANVPDWSHRLAWCRSETSDILKDSVESSPRLVKAALQTRTANGAVSTPDQSVIDEATEALKVLRAARKAIDSLALNNIVTKTRSLVEQVIETRSKSLIEQLRNAPSAERDELAKVVQISIEFARIVFDEEYAGLIRRSLHVAVNNPNLKSA
ncbi:MAG: hypothetical protein AAGL24_03455 [Pseudomonadota bacterium]